MDFLNSEILQMLIVELAKTSRFFTIGDCPELTKDLETAFA